LGSPFLREVRDGLRGRGYSLATEKTYLLWIKRFNYFVGHKQPIEVKTCRIGDYLTYLAVERGVSVNTQKTALNALVYLYQKHLGRRSFYSAG